MNEALELAILCLKRINPMQEEIERLRVENQKLRNALESVATMSEELSISGFARAALGE